MRLTLSVLAVLLLAGVLPASARAQSVIFSSDLTFRQPSTNAGLARTAVGIQTTVRIPDRGEALVGGNATVREGRNEFGTPLLGKTPFLNRGFNNTGYSRSIHKSTISARARIIRLAEEEERQTGVRP